MSLTGSASSAPCAIPMTPRPNTTGASFPDVVRQSISSDSGWGRSPFCPRIVSANRKALRRSENRPSSPVMPWVTTKSRGPSTAWSYPCAASCFSQEGGLQTGSRPSWTNQRPSMSLPAYQPGSPVGMRPFGDPCRREDLLGSTFVREGRSVSERWVFFTSVTRQSAPCGEDAGPPGVRGRMCDQLAVRTRSCATSSPSPDRATETSRRPELTWPRRPFAQCQSRTRHLAGIPRSISARTAGHASNVDENRPTTLFEGMRRSEYPIAPSIRISSPSPGRREYRPSSPLLKSYSTELSTSALFVRISFALRGAPCGDDSRALPALGGYHDEESTKIGPPDGSPPILHARVFEIGDRPRQRGIHGRRCFIERHAMLPFVLDGLVGVPIETDHAPDATDRPSPTAYHRRRCSTGVTPLIAALSF